MDYTPKRMQMCIRIENVKECIPLFIRIDNTNVCVPICIRLDNTTACVPMCVRLDNTTTWCTGTWSLPHTQSPEIDFIYVRRHVPGVYAKRPKCPFSVCPRTTQCALLAGLDCIGSPGVWCAVPSAACQGVLLLVHCASIGKPVVRDDGGASLELGNRHQCIPMT